jgi:hypothetical protein
MKELKGLAYGLSVSGKAQLSISVTRTRKMVNAVPSKDAS